jgi:hypothetical protein
VLLPLQVQLLDEKSLRKMLNALDKRVSSSSCRQQQEQCTRH